MPEITNTKWAAIYAKVLVRFTSLKRSSILTGPQYDEYDHLRLMINNYGKGVRSKYLFGQMEAATE
jgi:hypothetical protein